ncbi:hypothetical protein ACLOJK_019662, partial [Asimina triloba]
VARAPGSVRPRLTSWSTYGAPSLQRDGYRRSHRSSPPFCQQSPPEASHHAATARHPSAPSNVAIEGIVIFAVRTHHGRAIVAPIQAIHYDGDDEHIPDPSRPQADVDHRGHTRRIFLTQMTHGVFFSSPSRRPFSSKASVSIVVTSDPGRSSYGPHQPVPIPTPSQAPAAPKTVVATPLNPPARRCQGSSPTLTSHGRSPQLPVLPVSAITVHNPDNASGRRRHTHVHRPTAMHDAARKPRLRIARPTITRCQLLAIQHVGNVGNSVSRPQQATATTDIIGIEDVIAATVHRLLQ